MNILVVNAGSSSLKFQLITTDAERIASDTDVTRCRGLIERIGGEAVISLRLADGSARRVSAPLRDVRTAVDWLVTFITLPESGTGLETRNALHAVGHRVVHGGERYRSSTMIDAGVLHGIEEMIEFAPLHNPHNLRGIEAVRAVLGSGIPQVAVFDTAFHHTLPERAYLYAIPYALYRKHQLRRFGFHGTSHRAIAYRYRRLTAKPREAVRIITLHLGNGCSACAIAGGESVDTSMGFTPLEGLVMGTRSGDLDPALIDYIAAKEGRPLPQVEALLNTQSGLLGISGLTNDMRDLLVEAHTHEDRRARLAIEIFCYRVRKYIGSYLAVLGGADAVVFAGGIGENAPEIRARICDGLSWAGLRVDGVRNAALVGGQEGRISTADSTLQAWVIPTDEELLIARDTFRAVSGIPQPL